MPRVFKVGETVRINLSAEGKAPHWEPAVYAGIVTDEDVDHPHLVDRGTPGYTYGEARVSDAQITQYQPISDEEVTANGVKG